MPAGRPTKYSPRLADEMFALMAQGMSVVKVVKSDERFPAMATFFRWLTEKEEFKDKYEEAQRIRGQFFAEQLIDICDDTGSDVQFTEDEDENGQGAKPFICKENTAQRRLKIDTRKWIASRLLPKKYGDKVDVKHSGGLKILKLSKDEQNL